MHCFRCKSLMTETDKQASSRGQVIWFHCTVCGHDQLHAQPTLSAAPATAGNHNAAPRRSYAGG